MQGLEDKDIIMDVLTSQKHITSLYNTFSNECSTKNIKDGFIKILNEEHDIQIEVFDEMNKRGWYSPAKAESNKIESVKMKFNNIKKNI